MTEKFQLSATKREASKTARREVREAGRIPAVMYGADVDPIAISVDASQALRVYRKAGTSSIVELDVDGKKQNVIIKMVEIHPVKHALAHLDFMTINMKEKTTVSVNIEFIGESPAVKLGCTFMSEHTTIDLRCMPSDIPNHLDLDISVLKDKGDHLTIADLKLDSKKFELMGVDDSVVICSIANKGGAEAAEEDEAADAEATAEVEVEVTGQKNEEE